MYVFPMIDRASGEIILINRNRRRGMKTGWLDAEVYKLHACRVATHYGAGDLNEEYLATLEIPSDKDEGMVLAALRFYGEHLAGLPGHLTVVRAVKPLDEYRAARRKFSLDKNITKG